MGAWGQLAAVKLSVQEKVSGKVPPDYRLPAGTRLGARCDGAGEENEAVRSQRDPSHPSRDSLTVIKPTVSHGVAGAQE